MVRTLNEFSIRGRLEGKTVAIIINDSGLKYLSTDLWN